MTILNDLSPASHSSQNRPETTIRRIEYQTPELSLIRQSRAHSQRDSPIVLMPCTEAFSVITQLVDFKSHKLWRGKRLMYTGGHAKTSISITYLSEEWGCQQLSAFDNLRFHIPRSAIDSYTEEVGKRKISRFRVPPNRLDPVVFNLANALLPVLEHPNPASRLFCDHVALALYSHVTTHYGSATRTQSRKSGKLATWQEKRAKDFMRSNLAHNLSLEQIARECGLSRAHFARNFKNSASTSVHTWLQYARIEHAKQLLAGDTQTLAQIAMSCGFADQSHFTRVFRRIVGTAPGMWRRMTLCLPELPSG